MAKEKQIVRIKETRYKLLVNLQGTIKVPLDLSRRKTAIENVLRNGTTTNIEELGKLNAELRQIEAEEIRIKKEQRDNLKIAEAEKKVQFLNDNAFIIFKGTEFSERNVPQVVIDEVDIFHRCPVPATLKKKKEIEEKTKNTINKEDLVNLDRELKLLENEISKWTVECWTEEHEGEVR